MKEAKKYKVNIQHKYIKGNGLANIPSLKQITQEVEVGEELVIDTNQAVHRAPAGYRIMGISYNTEEGNKPKIERNFVYNSGTGFIKGMIPENKIPNPITPSSTVTIAIVYRRV